MKMKLVINKWTGGVMLAGLSLISLPVVAQEVAREENGIATPQGATPETTNGTQAGLLPIKVWSSVSHQFESDIEDTPGSVSITRFNVGVGIPVQLTEDWTLNNNFRYGLDYFDFHDIPSPWQTINTLTASTLAQWHANENWSYYGGMFIRSSSESGQSIDRGASIGGLIGLNYTFNENLTLGGGIAAMSQVTDDPLVLPLITAKWRFAEPWVLEAGLSDIATTGYGVDAKWEFSDEWDFTFGLQFHRSRFRIEGSGPSLNGVGQESALTLFADATWHPDPKVDLGGFVGLAAGGKLRLENSRGDELAENDYHTAAILGLKAAVRF
jgi:hypothetical protein